MAKKQSKSLSKKRTHFIPIGWREWVIFPDFSEFAIKAKIDTGARSSALHATHINEFEKDGQKWVKFRVYQSRDFLFIETPVVGYRKITNSFGNSEVRPVINMKIKMGNKSWTTDITLARRSKLAHPMLIGRKSLIKRHVIHSHKSFLKGIPKIKK